MKQIEPRIHRFVLVLLCLGFLAWVPAQAALHVKITESADQAIPVAIVPFGGQNSLPVDVAAVVSHDLKTTGLFDVLPRKQMLSRPHKPQAVNYANWRAIGTNNLVVGTIQPKQRGGYRIRFHILNVYTGRSIASFEVSAGDSGLRDGAHAVANLIYEELTDEEGYFLSRIAYVAVTRDKNVRRYRLMVADYDGHNPATIYSSRDPVMSPAWSPDGSHVAYVAFNVDRGRTSLRIQEVRTGEIRVISMRSGINGAPTWSPDGSKLAMTLSYEGDPDIYVYNLRTEQLRQLTHSSGIDTGPAWSPNGEYIAFTSDRGGAPQIYQMTATGGQIHRLTYSGQSSQDAVYSPNGKLLAFVQGGPNGYRIAVKNLKSGNARVVTDGPLDESPDFAPNGQAIIYATQGNRNSLATVSIDGQVHTRLNQPGKVHEPDWGPAP